MSVVPEGTLTLLGGYPALTRWANYFRRCAAAGHRPQLFSVYRGDVFLKKELYLIANNRIRCDLRRAEVNERP